MSMNKQIVPVILCGGAGSRLWPVSRCQHPKPFVRMADGLSLLESAYLRGANLPGVENAVVVTGADIGAKVEVELTEIEAKSDFQLNKHFILEPFGRNTAPAIAIASRCVRDEIGEDCILLVLPADHLILKRENFVEAVEKAVGLAQAGKIVTFGIKPTAPETGFGYIEHNGFDVVRFVEKPDYQTAVEYLDSGKFLWNSGMFCFSAKTMLHEMGVHCPELLELAGKCFDLAKRNDSNGISRLALTPECFEPVIDDSIDYAVMEHTQSAGIVPCDLGWSDIGSLRALGDLVECDADGNRLQGDVFVEDVSGCYIASGERTVAAVGVENLIIYDSDNALLVVDGDRSQDVKKIYSQLKHQDHEAHKFHKTVYRPWGSYTVLDVGEGFQTKRIEVKPGQILSLQLHHHRNEHWVVVGGTARVVNGERELVLKANESTYIPVECKHRLENVGDDMLVLIEVQTGDYLGEDDIVRFDDVYGRA